MSAENLPDPDLKIVATNHKGTVHIQTINPKVEIETQLISDVIYSSEDLEKHPEIKERIRYEDIPLV